MYLFGEILQYLRILDAIGINPDVTRVFPSKSDLVYTSNRKLVLHFTASVPMGEM